MNASLIQFSFIFSGTLFMTGFVRILVTRYDIRDTSLSKRIFCRINYDVDQSREVVVEQHSRGKVLNFGAILVPVAETKEFGNNSFLKIFFGQRNAHIDAVRVDGIKNPYDTIKQLKNNEEQG